MSKIHGRAAVDPVPASVRKSKKIVAQCPRCDAAYTYDGVKTLWGRLNRARQTTPDGKPVMITMPCCGMSALADEIQSMWGRATASRRQTYGAGPGRPKAPNRCPCGKFTLARAQQRNHKCGPPLNEVT